MMWEDDKFVSAHAFMAFLGYFWFWMGDIEVARWNGVDFPVPKHLRKSKIGLPEHMWAKNPYATFFLGHPVQWMFYIVSNFGAKKVWFDGQCLSQHIIEQIILLAVLNPGDRWTSANGDDEDICV